MSYSGGGVFQKRPGIIARLGDHERRLRYIERRKQPTGSPSPSGDGQQFWIEGGYSGLILETAGLMNYYRFTTAGGHTVYDDEYGGAHPAVLTEVSHGTPLTFTDVPPNDSDAGSANGSAVNPDSAVTNSTGDVVVMDVTANNAKWGTGGQTNFSFECWFSASSAQGAIGSTHGSGLCLFVGVSGLNGGYLEGDYTFPMGTGPLLRYRNQNGSNIVTAVPLAFDTWYHTVLTVEDSIQTAILYLNGVEVGRDNAHGAHSIPAANTWALGNNSPLSSLLRTWCGDMAEIALYNRALTPSEVLLHYNASGPSTDTGKWISIPFSSAALIGGKIGTDQIADGAVTSAKIADKTIATADIADGAVTTTQIADGTIAAVDIANALKPSGGAADTTEALRALGTTAGKAMNGKDGRAALVVPAYSASITPNASAAAWQQITASNGTAFTINAPSNPPGGAETQELTIEIVNGSGGALGAITWNAIFVFTNGAFVAPANTKKRFVTFGWNGSAWIEQSRANADY